MFKTVLLSAVFNLQAEFTNEDLAKEYFKESLKLFDAEQELENEEIEEEQGVGTKVKEVEICFSDDSYIIIKIKGYYKIYHDEGDRDTPGYTEHEFQSFDTLSIDNNSDLSDKEIHEFYN
jgi:hypothetical protein